MYAIRSYYGSHLLDMGCGRGRISYHFATLTGGQVSGYNIDPNQIENAIDWAAQCGMSDRLHFKVGDHHKPLEYESNSFDGCFSFHVITSYSIHYTKLYESPCRAGAAALMIAFMFR